MEASGLVGPWCQRCCEMQLGPESNMKCFLVETLGIIRLVLPRLREGAFRYLSCWPGSQGLGALRGSQSFESMLQIQPPCGDGRLHGGGTRPYTQSGNWLVL
jgi:hypothetical protein